MSEQLKESLSAVVDGEADTFEVRRVLDECGKNPELVRSWLSYELIGATLRREAAPSGRGMADAIWAAVEAGDGIEDNEALAPHGGRRRLLGPVAGIAVAATVALAVVFGLGGGDTPAPGGQELVLVNPVQEGEPVEFADYETQRANAYYLDHVRANAINNTATVVPFARTVVGNFEEK